jgi:hypothetical protein
MSGVAMRPVSAETINDLVTAALVILARNKVTPDIGEHLLYGDPMRGVPPMVLRKIIEHVANHILIPAPAPTVTIPLADYDRLLQLIEFDDMLVTCQVCGAWLDRSDPACAAVEDFNGCWKVASDRNSDQSLCRSYRATVREQPKTTP